MKSRKILRDKLELLRLANELGNISDACRKAGFSRDSFYRLRKAFAQGGVDALKQTSRRKPNLKNRASSAVEEAVLRVSEAEPRFGKHRVASVLRENGIAISPAGVRSIWLRHCLETVEQRLKKYRPETGFGQTHGEGFPARQSTPTVLGQDTDEREGGQWKVAWFRSVLQYVPIGRHLPYIKKDALPSAPGPCRRFDFHKQHQFYWMNIGDYYEH